VLQRLQTAVPVSHADGCQCLGSAPPEAQERRQRPSPRSGKGEAMPPSMLEPLTILAPSPSSETTSSGDARCGCGCGCGASLTQLALPQDSFSSTRNQASGQPAQS
jgi:hypothetical protein